MKRSILAGALLAVCVLDVAPSGAVAQSTPPSYPLYCKGSLTAVSTQPPNSLLITTTIKFTWSSKAASVRAPGQGRCAWADRGPRGTELGINTLHGVNNIPSNIGQNSLTSVSKGEYVEYGVYRDPENRYMVVTQIVGLAHPPFSSNLSLPPVPAPPPPK
jgi:hypothetical protein